MRVLLDECLPRRPKDDLPEHDGRDVFLTVDAGIEYQQSLGSLALGVIALKARSNRIEDLRPLMPRVRQLLGTIGPGRWERIS